MDTIACPCKRTQCEQHGNCEACRAHHQRKRKSLVYCEKKEMKERKRTERKQRRSR